MSCGRRNFSMHGDEEDAVWEVRSRWNTSPAVPPHSTLMRPGIPTPVYLTPTGSSGGGSPADSVTSSPPLRRALLGRFPPSGKIAQVPPTLDSSPESAGSSSSGHISQGLLTTADATRINMYSKPPPLNIPFAPSMPSYAAMAAAPRMYGAPVFNGPRPGANSVAYRCFPGSASTGGTGPPPPSGAVTRSPSPPPTMPGRECKFCKNNGETTQMYRSHSLRNPSDGRLICPVLRDHICDLCGATGDGAHTRNYCPQNSEKKKQAIPLYLKNTRRQSDGHYRL